MEIESEIQKDQQLKELTDASSLIPFGFMIVDHNGTGDILAVNEKLWKSCGCRNEKEFLNYTQHSALHLIHQDDWQTVSSKVSENNVPDSFRLHYRILTKKGAVLHAEDTCRKLNSHDIRNIYLHYLNLSEDASNQNFFDPVTGLHQKSYLYQWIREQYAFNKEAFTKTKIAAVYLSCRGFKEYNEAAGYEKGDALLRRLGRKIEQTFHSTMTARLYGSRFIVFTRDNDLESRILMLNEWMTSEKHWPLRFAAGIYYPDAADISPNIMADRAKTALDHIEDEAVCPYAVYTNELAESIRRKEYIQTHISDAIEKGWLRVYLQPVVRTVTGKVCGAEALSRWFDPVYGFISPAEFVPALEEKGISYLLARFVIEQVTSMLQKKRAEGKIVVPVSINFSRRDFETMNPYEEVEQAVLLHQLPRRLICIEITESMAMEDPEGIREAIQRFHESGYEVWMDDFGSAYSSLNSLKDFNFDEIKLDMVFMRNLSDRGKEIVVSCIQMAKRLKIHTLCEGVETKEQADFLRDIGCEKIQGYYYAKPVDPSMVGQTLIERGLSSETPAERNLYDAIGSLQFNENTSFAIIESNGPVCRFVYCSKRLLNSSIRRGCQYFEDGRILKPEADENYRKICSLVHNASISHQEEEITCWSNGHCYMVYADICAEIEEKRVSVVRFRDITDESKKLMPAAMDNVAQSFEAVFDAIYLLDHTDSQMHVIASVLPMEHTGQTLSYERTFASSLYQQDEQRFFAWSREALLLEKESRVSYFRFQTGSVTYAWHLVVILPYNSAEQDKAGDHLICILPPDKPDESTSIMHQTSELSDEPALPSARELICHQDVLKIFWKDKNRRFLGASRAFLSYYGISDESEIIGKTDDEIGWNANNADFHEEEEQVLNGSTIACRPGSTIVKGEMRSIIASKYPLVRNGTIIGLAGYFFDACEISRIADTMHTSFSIDKTTGCLTFEGWGSAITALENNFIREKTVYHVAMISMDKYIEIRNNFGADNAETMAQAAADVLKKSLGPKVILARGDFKTFMAVIKDEAGCREYLISALQNAEKLLQREIRLKTCHARIIISYGIASRAESGSIIEVVGKALHMQKKMEKTHC